MPKQAMVIHVRFPAADIALEKRDYEAFMAVLDDMLSSPPSPNSISCPSSPSAALQLNKRRTGYCFEAATSVEVSITHASFQLVESRGKNAVPGETIHRPFQLRFADVEHFNLGYTRASLNGDVTKTIVKIFISLLIQLA